MSDKPGETAIIVAQAGPLNGQRWTLQSDLVIGREIECDVVISDRQISRHHARLVPTTYGIQIEDLGSKNGTHVNGDLITNPVILIDGDIIQVALAQKFLFMNSDATLPLNSDLAKDATDFLANPDELSVRHDGGSKARDRKTSRLRLDKRSRRVWIAVEEGVSAGVRVRRKSSHAEIEIDPPLSASQYRLLELLYDRQGQVITRQELIVGVWGIDEAVGVSEQALDALVRRLRDRLAGVDPAHAYIVTVRGHGLRLENPVR